MFNDSQFKALVIYLEGPPPGTDILLDNLVVKRAARPLRATPPVIEVCNLSVPFRWLVHLKETADLKDRISCED